MEWDRRVGSIHYSGKVNDIALDKKPDVGDIVTLQKEGSVFHVEVTETLGEQEFNGIVHDIGPEPALGTPDVQRQSRVTFSLDQIHTLHCK